jgi:hypothetical protein
MMTDPRTPRTKEAQLPDALDQTPDAHPAQGQDGAHGSEDAELLAGAEQGEGAVEQPAQAGNSGSATP